MRSLFYAAFISLFLRQLLAGQATGWETFGNGPSHTGYYQATIGPGAFQPSWSKALNPGITQVAVAGNAVYVTGRESGGDGAQFYAAALDIRSGQRLWKYNLAAGHSINPPTYAAGKLYFQRGNHSTDTQLWCLNAASGTVAWVAPHGAQWEEYMAPTVVGDKVWVNGGGYGGIYGFKVADGAQLFFKSLAQYDKWTPSYYQGVVYSWVAGTLSAHNPTTGVVDWSVGVGWDWRGWSMNRVAAMANGRAFVVGSPGLHAIDLATRAASWAAPGEFTGTPAVSGNTVFGITGFEVKAYAADTGAYLGTYVATGGTGLWWHPIVTDDRVIVSNSSNTYVFDRATFQLLQTISGGGWPSFADGTLVISNGTTGTLSTYRIGVTESVTFDEPAVAGTQAYPVTETYAEKDYVLRSADVGFERKQGAGAPDNGTAYVAVPVDAKPWIERADGVGFDLISLDYSTQYSGTPGASTFKLTGYKMNGTSVSANLAPSAAAGFVEASFGPEWQGLRKLSFDSALVSFDNLRVRSAGHPAPIPTRDPGPDPDPEPDPDPIPEPEPDPDPNPGLPAAPTDALFEPYRLFANGLLKADAVAIGDVNSDGRSDVVVATEDFDNPKIHVFLQSPAGELVFDAMYSGGNGGSIAIADMNGDGRKDVLVTAWHGIGVLIQAPSGVLNPIAVTAGQYSSDKMRLGDFNGDGRKDVAAISWGGDYADVFLQRPAGGLEVPSAVSIPHGGYDDLEVADVNSDGLDDLVVMSGQGFGNLSVLLQATSGGFMSSVQNYKLGEMTLTSSIAVGDFNRDGRNDLAMSSWPYLAVEVFLQGSNGFLAPTWSIPSQDIDAMEAADVNGDGLADLIAIGGSSLYVFPQNSTSGFGDAATYTVPYGQQANPHSLAIGDVNGDGAPDVVAAVPRYGLTILYHRQILSPETAAGVKDAPFSYQILPGNRGTRFEADNLPAGLSLNTATGVISGTPTGTGVFAVAVRAYLSAKLCAGTVSIQIEGGKPARVVQGSYFTFVQDDNGPTFLTSGVLRVTVTASGSFTGKLRLGTTNFPLIGQLTGGVANLSISHRRYGRLGVAISIDSSDTPAILTAAITGDSWSASGNGMKRMQTGAETPVANAGYYTVAVGLPEPDTSEHIPNGFGAGHFCVSKRGAVRAIIRMPNGQVVAWAGRLAADGSWPFYVSTFQGAGMLAGDVVFADEASSDCTALINWFKPLTTGPRYPLDFGATLVLTGSRYVKPIGTPAPHASGPPIEEVGFAFGDLYEPIEASAKVRQDGTIRVDTPAGLQTRLRLNRATGKITGSFLHPRNGALMKVHGVMLQKSSAALGYFSGIVHSGIFAYSSHWNTGSPSGETGGTGGVVTVSGGTLEIGSGSATGETGTLQISDFSTPSGSIVIEPAPQ